MNKDKIYTQWTQQRRQVPVPENYTRRVVAAIENQTPDKRRAFFAPWNTGSNLFTRWGAALGLIALGLFRIVFVTANLFIGSTL